MSVATLTLPHLPPDLRIYIALFTNVHNASAIRSHLLAGNSEFEYAFMDATTVLSLTHLSASIFRALNDYLNARIRSRNVHSEIVYCLGYNNNIASTLNTFGITNTTSELLTVKVSCSSLGLNPDITRESVESHLRRAVEGDMLDVEQLGRKADVEKVRRLYKLNTVDGKGEKRRRKDGSLEGMRAVAEDMGLKGDDDQQPLAKVQETRERQELVMQILGLMALRGAV